MTATIDAIRRELGHGPLLDRYSGEDGLTGGEGAFLCCSFWLVDALARERTRRRCDRADEPTNGRRERRGALRRGSGSGHRRVPRKHSSGPRPSRLDQRSSIGEQGYSRHEHLVWNAGGFVGTMVLTTALSAAGELGLTRMDLPFLLGTMVSSNRSRAKALGYAMHFVVGQLFALVYFGIFTAIGHSGWWLGAALGLAHGVSPAQHWSTCCSRSSILGWAHHRVPPPTGHCWSHRDS